MQHNKDVKHQDLKLYCAANHFNELKFLGPHNKPPGVYGLGKHYHMCFDTKLGHVTYSIRHIPCDCTPCTSSLGRTWIPCFLAHQKPRYQHKKYFTYWHVLGSFNSWSILKLSHKATYSEWIDKINQFLLDGIIDNMDHWNKQVNMVPLIQHKQPQWDTMWLNSRQNPTYYKKIQVWWTNQ